MFSNLSKGSVLYGLDTKDRLKLFTASVDSITLPKPKYIQNTYGQLPEMVVDIVAIINGERKEFKQVPSNTAIADFGPTSFILADSRDSLLNHVNAMLKTSKDIVASISKHEERIEDCQKIILELNPSLAAEAQRDGVILDLQKQVSTLTNQLAQVLNKINPEPKTE